MTLRDAAGMNAATIWRLEEGNRDPKVGTVVQLIQALNAPSKTSPRRVTPR
jgi:predicted transcriptional regulator